MSFIGCGNFAKAVLLPTLKKTADVRLRGICTASGMRRGWPANESARMAPAGRFARVPVLSLYS